jgi:hypothetical protein
MSLVRLFCFGDCQMLLFLSGVYFAGVVFTFLIVGFFCCLAGRNSDLWRPFVYAALWPVMLPLFIAGKAG